jgi:prepilin-type N-terminal cleavage/methylation domain-containing protein
MHHAHRAFSLVEVVLVLAIMTVVALMAVPRYASAANRQRAAAAVHRIAADLAAAQARARTRSTSQSVSFVPASGQYTVAGMADPDHPARAYVVDLKDEPYALSSMSADLGGDATIVFDGYGAPDSGGTIIVQAGDSSRTITIDPDTGVATVQ